MAIQTQTKGGLKSDINMTPMIDIMLVLLIIFMIVQQGLQRGLSVLVPPVKEESEPTRAVSQVVLEVLPEQVYLLNQQPVAAAALEPQLRALFAARADKVIFVRGAETVTYGDVIVAVDAARAAGVQIVGLVPRS
jgi:biopolymer transport protein TolR